MKRAGKIIIKFIGLAILIVILSYIDFNEFIANLGNINIGLLAIACLLILLVYLFKALRWRFLISLQGIEYPVKDSLLAFMGANFVAYVTPGRVGEVIKAHYLKKDKNVPLAKSVPSVILDRIFDVYCLLIVAVIGILQFSIKKEITSVFYISTIVLFILPWLVLNKKIVFPLTNILTKYVIRGKIGKKIQDFSNELAVEFSGLLSYKLITAVFFTLAAYLTLFFSGKLLIIAMGLDIPFITLSSFIAIANVLSFLPISFAGLGTREASMIFLFSLINLNEEKALLFSLLLFFTFFIMGGIYGYIGFLLKPIKLSL
ncbi:MAG: lysylphosphatidylglycerol synthase transmembrane domain-containing protein [Thiohalospira sp.]